MTTRNGKGARTGRDEAADDGAPERGDLRDDGTRNVGARNDSARNVGALNDGGASPAGEGA